MQIIDAHQDLLARLENSVWTVWPANQALQVNQACPETTHQFLCHPMDVVVGVHPAHQVHQVHLAQLDHPEIKANQAIQVHQLKTAVPAVQAAREVQANQENKAIQAQQATPDDQPKPDKKATTDHPVVQANQVQVAPTPNAEVPESQAPLVPTVPPAIQDLVANPATKVLREAKVRMAVLARTPNIVLVPDEERLPKRKSRKPKTDTIRNFILLVAISIKFLC